MDSSFRRLVERWRQRGPFLRWEEAWILRSFESTSTTACSRLKGKSIGNDCGYDTSCIKVNKAIFGSSTKHLNHSEGDPIDPKGIVQKRAQEDRGRIRGLKQRVMEKISPNENAGKSRDRHMKRGCAACQVNLYMRSNCWSKFHEVRKG